MGGMALGATTSFTVVVAASARGSTVGAAGGTMTGFWARSIPVPARRGVGFTVSRSTVSIGRALRIRSGVQYSVSTRLRAAGSVPLALRATSGLSWAGALAADPVCADEGSAAPLAPPPRPRPQRTL